ncbi:hypothetical protein SYNPS1DRAFT_30281 [Syncephalis pseudoplumigaleata]|uniref:MutL C-terminal dimerisation domain-containing protein n=1 Tax=Syncephalis pseudoplumigaleata TaxID=1712513 RepID=A0A4P9YVM3_9FUNG|nr:hypothetical protein SYNPS1DRAFT_30281 [Syncephalis pseudoplumigaleata]|eukprot:RKP23944.1 hypothetical protein SYNPS1DRAFT_30281 [Syncephalis pseudoplumigaleata]
MAAYALKHRTVRFTLWNAATHATILDVPPGEMRQRLYSIYGQNADQASQAMQDVVRHANCPPSTVQLFFDQFCQYSAHVALHGWFSWSKWTVKNDRSCRTIAKDVTQAIARKQLAVLQRALSQLIAQFLATSTGRVRRVVLGNGTTIARPMFTSFDYDATSWRHPPSIASQPPPAVVPSRRQAVQASASWTEQLYRTWTDPVFAVPELFIANCSIPARCNARLDDRSLQRATTAGTCTVQLARTSISSMRVLGQLDSKFIAGLVSMPTHRTSSAMDTFIVLVDQHAAHERVLYEWLQDQYVAISRGILDGLDGHGHWFPVPLSPQERSAATVHRTTLAYWGIVLHVPDTPDSSPMASVPAILHQCYAHQTSVLVRMVQDCIHELASLPEQHRLASCPSSIQATLKEMACQRAVKFNDVLSIAFCHRLVQQLARCRLPFQCAHGRPSIVPLVRLTSVHDEPTPRSIHELV